MGSIRQMTVESKEFFFGKVKLSSERGCLRPSHVLRQVGGTSVGSFS